MTLNESAVNSPPITMPGWYPVVAYLSLAITACTLGAVAFSHLCYPGFTETMEGDILQHIERAATGQPIYPPPQAEFIALTYLPFYYYLAAPFYLVFGDSFFGPRLLSLLATVGSAFWIWRITLRESGSYPTAALGLAIFCGSYQIMDAALFTVHPDALLLFWVLSGYWFLAYGSSRRDDLLWLLSFTLAFWTKQHGALFFGWAVLYALLFRQNFLPRWGLILGMVLGGPVAYGVMGTMLGERFWFHTLLAPQRWEQSWSLSIRRALYVITVLAPVAFLAFLEFARRTWLVRGWKPHPLVWFILTSLLTVIYTMRISGASNNHYAPLHALFAVTFALIVHRLVIIRQPAGLHWLFTLMTVASAGIVFVAVRNYSQHEIPQHVPLLLVLGTIGLFAILRLPPHARPRGEAMILVVTQFGVMFFNPIRYLPSEGWKENLEEFRAELKQLNAPIVWIDYGNIPTDLTGFKLARTPSWVALEDIDRQQIPRSEIETDLLPWRERIESMPEVYLLSFDRLDRVPVWKEIAPQFQLVHDYGERFSRIRQIADHWFGSGGAPRFLYQKKP